jgi:hypothetical protein
MIDHWGWHLAAALFYLAACAALFAPAGCLIFALLVAIASVIGGMRVTAFHADLVRQRIALAEEIEDFRRLSD